MTETTKVTIKGWVVVVAGTGLVGFTKPAKSVKYGEAITSKKCIGPRRKHKRPLIYTRLMHANGVGLALVHRNILIY